MIRRWWKANATDGSYDGALLLLRAWFGGDLLLKHGLEKVFTFSQMAAHFPDPLHIGVIPSLIFAMFSDAICSTLLILGFATRWAALVILTNLLVAWGLVHHFAYRGPQGDHGELIVLYLGGFLAILIAGPGRWSLDAITTRRR